MRYTAVALLLLGVAQSVEMTSLNQIESKTTAMESESSSDNDVMNVQLDKPKCIYLDETTEELDYQIDMFSRTLDTRHWTNAVNIYTAMSKKGKKPHAMHVHTWELYDTAFSFPRVRRYDEVQANMDMLEHFQDNLNQNISNSVNADNFSRVCKTIRKNFNTKYHNGEYDDPASTDPRAVLEAKTPPQEWTKP